MQPISAETLRDILRYDIQTGVFVWRNHRRSTLLGKVAGYRKRGQRSFYVGISIYGQEYAAHRLAWLYVTGRWPKAQIDHKDMDGTNNSFSNLREASRSQNLANSPRRLDNSSGYKGVCWFAACEKWRADIAKDGKRHYLGLFDTAEAAHEAYAAAATKLHGEFARS